MTGQEQTAMYDFSGWEYAFACWHRQKFKGEWEWVSAHFASERFDEFKNVVLRGRGVTSQEQG